MDIGYTIEKSGFINPSVSLEGKDSLPIVTFLVDIRLCTDAILAEIDAIVAGDKQEFDWSGDAAFATITPETSTLEAQWVRDDSGNERGETLPTQVLREIVSTWREILLRLRK
jgi:hypothetical protein